MSTDTEMPAPFSLLCLTLSRCLDIHRRGVCVQHMEYNGLQTPRQQGQFHLLPTTALSYLEQYDMQQQ